jgi:predicted nucleic acid-binding protein
MTSVFADTFYFLALLNAKDAKHEEAWEISRQRRQRLVTTGFVLIELADGLSRSARRHVFSVLLDELRNESENILVPATQELFEEGAELYNARPDKQWTLTDCISFVVMKQQGISEALTGDHHFEQAGFVALLK